jgi:hypothetical protein
MTKVDTNVKVIERLMVPPKLILLKSVVIRVIVFLKPLLTIYQLYRGDQFLGGGNRDTMRKPPTCRKSLPNLSHNLVSSTPSHERDSNFSDDRH